MFDPNAAAESESDSEKETAQEAQMVPEDSAGDPRDNSGGSAGSVVKSDLILASPRKSHVKSGPRANRVLKDIQRRQASTKLLISKPRFSNLVLEILQKEQGDADLRLARSAVDCLQEAAEAMLCKLFKDANHIACHARRVTVNPQDVALLLKVRGD